MANLPGYGKSVSDWDPGAGTGADAGKQAKLMGTTAKDASDTMTGTNELKAYEGGKGHPSGDFGTKGKQF